MSIFNLPTSLLSNKTFRALGVILSQIKFANKSKLESSAINGSLISNFVFPLQTVLQLFSNVILSRLLFPLRRVSGSDPTLGCAVDQA